MSFKQFFDRLVENSLVTPVTPNSPIVAVPCSFLPFPVLKYNHLFQIKYAEAILSNNSGKLLWFEITKMMSAVKEEEKITVSFIIIFGTLAFPREPSQCLIIITPSRAYNRGGFRHVQHVRPNRGPTKGPFFHFLQHSNKPEILK